MKISTGHSETTWMALSVREAAAVTFYLGTVKNLHNDFDEHTEAAQMLSSENKRTVSVKSWNVEQRRQRQRTRERELSTEIYIKYNH